MACIFSPNQTITSTLQWWQISNDFTFSPNNTQTHTCPANYIRPDPGGARMPWVLVVLQILVHSPVIAWRIAKWEDVQTLSIVLAAINIGIVIQAYASTHLAAEGVLVWSPVVLVLDAGAMLQLIVLVRKEHPHWWRRLLTRLRPQSRYAALPTAPAANEDEEMRIMPPAQHPTPQPSAQPQLTPPPPTHPAPLPPASAQQPPVPERPPDPDSKVITPHNEAGPIFVAFVLITSSLLFTASFALQITGLVAAFRGHYRDAAIESLWCSPSFGLFTVAELDLNCTFHTVIPDVHKGIGCIVLPGARQEQWLIVTIVFVVVSVVLEAGDFIILLFVPDSWKMFGQHLKRPFLTMGFGFATLVVIAAAGAADAYTLPQGISEKVWLIFSGQGDPFACTSTLTPAGLRGQFLGWLDGLLQAWKAAYFGS